MDHRYPIGYETTLRFADLRPCKIVKQVIDINDPEVLEADERHREIFGYSGVEATSTLACGPLYLIEETGGSEFKGTFPAYESELGISF
jgi:hypothetical protein